MPEPIPAHIAAFALFASLVFYALTAGADFGGGVWDLLASGPRKDAQRKLISDAIGPIWEANHVWLILALVLMFTAFPPALALMTTSLHWPLTLLMFGIVFRGTAFTFRHYSPPGEATRWQLVFAIASVISPVLLGVVAGALMSGRPTVWYAPFPLAVGAWTLTLFSYLAASYLAVEAEDAALREDFTRRALVMGVVVFLLGGVVFALTHQGAPVIWAALRERKWAWSVPTLNGINAAAALWLLWKKRVVTARVFVAVQVVVVLLGWACAQYPLLIAPDLTIEKAAAPRATLLFIDGALGLGALLLFPSLYYLFKVFKGEKAFSIVDEESSG
jgi:cytochrome bd ubiquinol oxidase subunit II